MPEQVLNLSPVNDALRGAIAPPTPPATPDGQTLVPESSVQDAIRAMRDKASAGAATTPATEAAPVAPPAATNAAPAAETTPAAEGEEVEEGVDGAEGGEGGEETADEMVAAIKKHRAGAPSAAEPATSPSFSPRASSAWWPWIRREIGRAHV